MNETRLKTVAQLRAFLEGTLEVRFQPIRNDVERYGFIVAVLGRFAYRRLVRADNGVLMRYLARITGYSRAQLRRLVSRCLKGEQIAKRYRAPAVGFARTNIDGAMFRAPLEQEQIEPNPTDRGKKWEQASPAGRRPWRPLVVHRDRGEPA